MSNPDLTIVGWRAWYTGGRYFDSTTTTWEDLPELGVLYVIVYCRSRPRSRSMSTKDLYWLEITPEGDIYACGDVAGSIISQDSIDNNRVKRGKWVTDQEMAEVVAAAQPLLGKAPDETLRID